MENFRRPEKKKVGGQVIEKEVRSRKLLKRDYRPNGKIKRGRSSAVRKSLFIAKKEEQLNEKKAECGCSQGFFLKIKR